jgi:hypothetical protein
VLSLIVPENVPLRPASLKLIWSPLSFASSSGTLLPSTSADPEKRVTCCLRSSRVTAALPPLAGSFTFQLPSTFAGTTYR